MNGNRIGVITTKDRTERFKEALPRGTIVECNGEQRIMEAMRELSRKAINIAVVDDAALAKPETDELEILDWAALPTKHPMRIVFAASSERTRKDPFLSALLDAGIYDIVLPEDADALFAEVGARVVEPYTSEQAEEWLRSGMRPSAKTAAKRRRAKAPDEAETHPYEEPKERVEMASMEDGEIYDEPSWGSIMPDKPKTTVAAPRKRKVISCASLFGHPGATTLSMSLAFWLAKTTRKKTVCALSDTAFFNHLKAGFKAEPLDERFEHKDVVFCAFAHAEEECADASWAIYDCGRLLTTSADTPASSAHRRYYTSDIKLMCVQGQPWDMPKAKEALQGLSPSEVASWTWCVRSTSSDFLAQLRGYLADMGADTAEWFRTPENPEFFARRNRDGFDGINYDGLLGKRSTNREGERL